MTESTPPPDQRWSDPAAPEVPASSHPATGTSEPRPGRVTWGSITLIVLGALTAVLGVLALLGGAAVSNDPSILDDIAGLPAGFEEIAGTALIGIAIVFLVWGAAEIWVAIKALAGRNWARITGIVLACLGALFALLGILGSFGATAAAQQEGGAGGLILNVVLLAAYAFVIYAYATAGSWFKSRSA